jgi:ubiquinone/menaquinone biosynthesis C-methylase UbiE
MERREAGADRRGVRETYDRIAEHFAKTREYPWPEVTAFLEAAPAGGLGLDLGCGNGRHVPPLADRTDRTVGVDASGVLLAVARRRLAERGHDADSVALVQGDAARIPIRDDAVDLAVYVATLHHLPERGSRVGSLDELARVLARGGRALVSAWSTEHDTFDPETGFDTTVEWTLPDGETVDRFYHVYDPEEFRADLDASDLTVVESFVSSGNCYARVGPEGTEHPPGSEP